jgi:hypothetical protein
VHEQILCLSAEDGNPKWIGQMGGDPIAKHAVTIPLLLFIDGDRLLAYNRTTAVAAALDRRNGKLIWEREVLPPDDSSQTPAAYGLSDFSSGASFSAGRLLVYGRHAAVLDSATGKTIWTFEAGRARSFPIKLPSPEDQASGGSLVAIASQWSQPQIGNLGAFRRGSQSSSRGQPNLNYLSASQSQSDSADFARQGGTLVAPAASWAEWVHSGQLGMGTLAGTRMLLFGNGIDLLSMDLPLAGQHRNLHRNSFVGASGNKACFLSDQRLAILNLSHNTLATADLSWVVDANPFELQVALAGARAYATGRNGIVCINLHNGREIFRSPWPQTVRRFFLGNDSDRGAAKPPRMVINHQWHGRIASPSTVQNSRYQQLAMLGGPGQFSRQTNVALPACFPMSSAIAHGRIYSLIAPHQLVALSHSDTQPTNADDASELPD